MREVLQSFVSQREDLPFCTRSWAAVTFFFFPACPSALSAFCCSFFCRTHNRQQHSWQIFPLAADWNSRRQDAGEEAVSMGKAGETGRSLVYSYHRPYFQHCAGFSVCLPNRLSYAVSSDRS